MPYTIGKAFDEGYNFVLDLISIRGLHTKLWASKVTRIPNFKISKFPFGSPIWGCVNVFLKITRTSFLPKPSPHNYFTNYLTIINIATIESHLKNQQNQDKVKCFKEDNWDLQEKDK